MVNGSRRYSADLPQGGLEIPCILTFRTNNAKLSDNSKKLIEASLAMNIKILKTQNEKVKVEPPNPVPSSSLSVHGNDIKVEETSISSNSDNNLVDPFPGILKHSSSLSTASIGEPRAKNTV